MRCSKFKTFSKDTIACSKIKIINKSQNKVILFITEMLLLLSKVCVNLINNSHQEIFPRKMAGRLNYRLCYYLFRQALITLAVLDQYHLPFHLELKFFLSFCNSFVFVLATKKLFPYLGNFTGRFFRELLCFFQFMLLLFQFYTKMFGFLQQLDLRFL